MHWKGLQDEHSASEDLYIRYMAQLSSDCLDTHGSADEDLVLEGNEPVRVILCMTKDQSRRLAKASFLQSDIAFKRVVGFKEFELGGMDLESNTCKFIGLAIFYSGSSQICAIAIVYCRVLLTRENAAIHRFIFHKIDEVVKEDTGSLLQWRHLHSRSIDQPVGILHWAGDQHLGQAKGMSWRMAASSRII